MSNFMDQQLISSGIIDRLKLNKKRYTNITESRNLLCVYEQQLFVWHDVGSCILSVELKKNEPKSDLCKVLLLTNPPVFEIESLCFNRTGSLLAISGKNGIMVYEVPWRYGKFNLGNKNTDTFLGRSWNIAEHFFICSSRVGVIQVSWHPASTSSTHLTILSTDNYIRIYNVADPQTPQQIISLGPISKNSFLTSDTKFSLSTCLGENVVSFDFGPSEEMKVSSINRNIVVTENIIWPIFLLRGNGDVYVLKIPFKEQRCVVYAKIIGPLIMYPPAEDNYGFDACSILCLQSTPPCIVVATASGMLHHCLVLENFNSSVNEDKKGLEMRNESCEEGCDISLYVYESIELPLTINEEPDDVYCHPLHLIRDITSNSKYHCSHLSGVHSIAMPFLHFLEEYVEKDSIENFLSQHQKHPSIVEHLLCTKFFNETSAIPVLGLDVTVSDAGIKMICLLASWEFVCLSLVSSFHSSVPRLLTEDLSKSASLIPSSTENFEQTILNHFQRSLCSPLLKSFPLKNQDSISSQQWLDLLCNATQRLREDYIQRMNSVHTLLQSRIKVLMHQKEFQLTEIKNCQEEKEKIQNEADKLNQKYKKVQAEQERLVARLERTLQFLQQNFPILSTAEIKMKENLLSMEEKLKTYDVSLQQIKKKLKYQTEKMKETKNNKEEFSLLEEKMANINLNKTQLKHLKELLSQEGDSVAQLIGTLNTLKKITGFQF